MAFKPERYGAPLAAVLNSLQAIRNDELVEHRARMHQQNIPHAEFCSPFVVPTEGTLAEADAISFHYYQSTSALCGPLQANTHGLADAMRALAPDNNGDIHMVRRLLYELSLTYE